MRNLSRLGCAASLLGAALLGALPAVAQGPAAVSSPTRAALPSPAAAGLHVVVLRSERRIQLRDGPILLYEASVAVGKGGVLEHAGRRWDFTTPAGQRTVRAKQKDPVWVPPDWHYVELARERGFALVRLEHGRDVLLRDSSGLAVYGERIVRLRRDGTVDPLPPGEEIIFDSTVYIPPFGTANRRIRGELGRYKLDLGGGYLIHGTPQEESVGKAVTHGCIRMHEKDLALLYRSVPVGTPVFIY